MCRFDVEFCSHPKHTRTNIRFIFLHSSNFFFSFFVFFLVPFEIEYAGSIVIFRFWIYIQMHAYCMYGMYVVRYIGYVLPNAKTFPIVKCPEHTCRTPYTFVPAPFGKSTFEYCNAFLCVTSRDIYDNKWKLLMLC